MRNPSCSDTLILSVIIILAPLAQMEDPASNDNNVDKSRYWLSKGQFSLDDLPIEDIDVVAAIESVKVWDEIGQYRQCCFCKKVNMTYESRFYNFRA